MKFLLVATLRDSPPPIPPDTLLGMVRAARAAVEEQLENGQTDCVYWVAGGHTAVAVVNGDSVDEVHTRILDFPTYPMAHWKVIPLADWKSGVDYQIKMLGG
jgi:muconolactone delta-isomerase